MGDFVKELLEALEDKKVKEKIRKIVAGDEKKKSSIFDSSSEKYKREVAALKEELARECENNQRLSERIRQLEGEKGELQEKLHSAKMEMSDLKGNIDALAKKNIKLKAENTSLEEDREKEISICKKNLEQAEKISEFYRDHYERIEHCFQLYRELGNDIHRDLARVLSAESPELFFAWGIQWGNIEALWEFISYQLERYDKKQLENLQRIFDYFFALYEKVNPRYQRLAAQVGEEFDGDIHTRSVGSAVCGHISQVLLQGYCGNNGKIKKSIVKI